MNNRGYAISAIIYPLLLVCLILVLSILSDLENKKNILDIFKNEQIKTKYDSYEDGTIIYFNPKTGEKCDDYVSSNSNTGNTTGCMKWYIFGDIEGALMVNMILDHNTTASIAWNSSNLNTIGPSSTFLNALKSSTDNWTGVPTRSDSYNFDNGTSKFTIDYNGYRARIITAQEVANISKYYDYNDKIAWFYLGSNNTTDTSKRSNYGWLYDRTSTNCKNYGCSNNSNVTTWGYWTATPLSGFDNLVLVVSPYGRVDNYYPNGSNSSWGIRPVITILKSTIK